MNVLLLLLVPSATIGNASYEFSGVVEVTSAQHQENIRFIDVGDPVSGRFTVNLGTSGVPFVNNPLVKVNYPGAIVRYEIQIGDESFSLSSWSNNAQININGRDTVTLAMGLDESQSELRGQMILMRGESGLIDGTSLSPFQNMRLVDPYFRIVFPSIEYIDLYPHIRIDLQSLERPQLVFGEWKEGGRSVVDNEQKPIPEPTAGMMLLAGFVLVSLRNHEKGKDANTKSTRWTTCCVKAA